MFLEATCCLLDKNKNSMSHSLTKRGLTLFQKQHLDSSNLKEFADENLEFDENSWKFFKWVENTVGEGEIAHHEQ